MKETKHTIKKRKEIVKENLLKNHESCEIKIVRKLRRQNNQKHICCYCGTSQYSERDQNVQKVKRKSDLQFQKYFSKTYLSSLPITW